MKEIVNVEQLSMEQLQKEYDEARSAYAKLISTYSFLQYHLFADYRAFKIRLNRAAAELNRRLQGMAKVNG